MTRKLYFAFHPMSDSTLPMHFCYYTATKGKMITESASFCLSAQIKYVAPYRMKDAELHIHSQTRIIQEFFQLILR